MEREENEHDPYFKPIITLPEVEIPTLEENEDVLICLRAKLYRLDKDSKEWKERGTGDVKLLHDPVKKTVRLVMRRDKTKKICANHYVTGDMELKPNSSSNRAWVWNTLADFADEESKSEILAIMFQNKEIAEKWKKVFEEGQKMIISEDSINDNHIRDRKNSDGEESDSASEDDSTDYVKESKPDPEKGTADNDDILSEDIKNMNIKEKDK